MSFENPTRLRIGMHGDFSGKDYRVLGRVVMGESEDDETYYWHEFNLKTGDGNYADLIYEVTERGGQWRLFTMFDPEYPHDGGGCRDQTCWRSAKSHRRQCARDFLRDFSRVYRIEGMAPEGDEVGDVAEYFNAEASDIMQVVSWTGDEVEFYNGVKLTREVVNSAFKLPPEPGGFSGITRNFSSLSSSGSGNSNSSVKFAVNAVGVVILLFFIFFGHGLSCSTDYEASAVKHFAAGRSAGRWRHREME